MAESTIKLVQSATFATTVVDFYRNPKDIWMTREQIGTALEYAEPSKAIAKIHERHQERLDPLSSFVRLGKEENGKQFIRDSYLYSAKGVYEICRWSQQPKADAFFDWVYDRIEDLRTGRLAMDGRYHSTKAVDPVRLLREIRLSVPKDTDLWPVARQIYQQAGIDLPETVRTVVRSPSPRSITEEPDLDTLRQTLQTAFNNASDRIVGWGASGPWVLGHYVGVLKTMHGIRYLIVEPQWFRHALSTQDELWALRILREAGWLRCENGKFVRIIRLGLGQNQKGRPMTWLDIERAGLIIGEAQAGSPN